MTSATHEEIKMMMQQSDAMAIAGADMLRMFPAYGVYNEIGMEEMRRAICAYLGVEITDQQATDARGWDEFIRPHIDAVRKEYRSIMPSPDGSEPRDYKAEALEFLKLRDPRALNDGWPSLASWIIDAVAELIEQRRFTIIYGSGCGVINTSEQPDPVPMIMHCVLCGTRHIDEGEFADKPHHTHACQGCGHVWRPAKVNTVGVQFLPGYKNNT